MHLQPLHKQLFHVKLLLPVYLQRCFIYTSYLQPCCILKAVRILYNFSCCIIPRLFSSYIYNTNTFFKKLLKYLDIEFIKYNFVYR